MSLAAATSMLNKKSMHHYSSNPKCHSSLSMHASTSDDVVVVLPNASAITTPYLES